MLAFSKIRHKSKKKENKTWMARLAIYSKKTMPNNQANLARTRKKKLRRNATIIENITNESVLYLYNA